MYPLLGATLVLWWALGARAFTLFFADMTGRAERAAKEVVRSLGARPHLRRHLDTSLGEVVDQLARYGTLVTTIVVVAPLTGLLGTVIGMMETFDALGEMALYTQSGGIAGGISQALLTTQAGLTVAIPGLLAGRVLKRRQAAIEDKLELIKDRVCIAVHRDPTPTGAAA